MPRTRITVALRVAVLLMLNAGGAYAAGAGEDFTMHVPQEAPVHKLCMERGEAKGAEQAKVLAILPQEKPDTAKTRLQSA